MNAGSDDDEDGKADRHSNKGVTHLFELLRYRIQKSAKITKDRKQGLFDFYYLIIDD
jgi:hypothetical protein